MRAKASKGVPLHRRREQAGAADDENPAAARALEALRADPVAALREGREPHFTELGPRTAEMNRLLGELADARHEPAVPFVIELWRRHPWPMVRQRAERLLLEWGSPDALVAVAETLEAQAKAPPDEDGARSLSAIEAVLRLGAGSAYDRLAPYFDPGRTRDPVASFIAGGALALLGRAGREQGMAETRELSRSWLFADGRWTELALRVLGEREDGALHGAIACLLATRDQRAAPAIAALLEREVVDVDTVIRALRALGDASVAPALRAAAAARKRKKAEAAKLSALAAELEG